MMQHLQSDLMFRRTQSLIQNKNDSILNFISAGIPWADAYKMAQEQYQEAQKQLEQTAAQPSPVSVITISSDSSDSSSDECDE